MEKTCNGGNLSCSFKCYAGSFMSCQYSGYCDYQAPKDSRNHCLHESSYALTNGEMYCTICGAKFK
jgi:hypothetical protein